MPQGWTDGFMPNGSSPNCLADFRIELQTTFVLQSRACVPVQCNPFEDIRSMVWWSRR